jgi:hypothetical protein
MGVSYERGNPVGLRMVAGASAKRMAVHFSKAQHTTLGLSDKNKKRNPEPRKKLYCAEHGVVGSVGEGGKREREGGRESARARGDQALHITSCGG